MKLNNSLKSLMALALVFGLTACQTPTDSTGSNGSTPSESTQESSSPSVHEHTFADEWSKDDTHHWKASTCGHADAEVKVEHTYGEPVEKVEGTAGTRTWTCECGYEKVEPITNLAITYKYADGTVLDTYSAEVKEGETYSVPSPAVDFMAPSVATVEGTMDADGEAIEVVYDYSTKPLSNPIPGYRYDKLMVDETKGLSFTMTTNGAYRDWEEMIAGDTFVIFNGCLRNRDAQWPAVFSGDWYDGGASEAALGRNYWDVLLTRADRNEIVVTWSINPDGSIAAYKNGEKVLLFAADKEAEGFWCPSGAPKPRVSDMVQSIYAEVAEKGFRMGGWHNDSEGRHLSYHRNLTVGYAMDDAAAKALADSYTKTTTVNMVDENGDAVRRQLVFRDQADTEILAPYVEGYSFLRKEEVAGATNFIYKPIGEEKVTEEIKNAGTNVVNTVGIPYDQRQNTQYWYVLGEGFTGDQILTVNVNTKGGDWVDQSVLPVIFDSTNKENCYIQRLDWFGTFHGAWNNGNIDNPAVGINALVRGNEWHYGGNWDTVAAPMIMSVLDDADMNITFIKKAGSLAINIAITANSGEYAGQSFNFNSCIINLPGNSFGFALTGLNCTYTVNSVHY